MQGLVDLLYPPACLGCPSVLPAPSFFCERCEIALERLPADRCERCSEPGLFGGPECPRCEEAPPPFRRAWAPFAHVGSMARAIHRFKYEDRPELARPLAELLAREAREQLDAAPELVVPLPLHAGRFRARKYDQAHLLAEALAVESGRPRPLSALTRRRATRRQVGLSETERAANVAGAFEAHGAVAGNAVLLVDDVLTTGATARAASAALKAAGALEVEVLTLARAFTSA